MQSHPVGLAARLGIDIGDLDLTLHIGVPPTVALGSQQGLRWSFQGRIWCLSKLGMLLYVMICHDMSCWLELLSKCSLHTSGSLIRLDLLISSDI